MSIFRNAREMFPNLPEDSAERSRYLTDANLSRLTDEAELGLLRRLALFPRLVEAAAEASGRKAGVHLKIDTGMERIGVHSYSSAPFVEAAVASKHCALKGV